MMASRLIANAHLVTISTHEHATLTGAVNLAHLALDETVFEPIASCYASVMPEDRVGGVVLVDIGAHSTELVCYFGESVQLASTIKICGDHFSRDIAFALHVPLEDGALVKEEFGSAVAEGTAENSVVELPFRDGAGRDSREVPRLLVNRILESRAQELFAMVRDELACRGAVSGAGQRPGDHGRGRAAARHLRHRGAGTAKARADRTHAGLSGFAGGIERPGVDDGGRPFHVRRPVADAGGSGSSLDGIARKNTQIERGTCQWTFSNTKCRTRPARRAHQGHRRGRRRLQCGGAHV
jgi:hypothetical protein